MLKPVLISVLLVGATAFCVGIYLLPVLVGWLRRVPDIGALAVVNVLLGWTLLGWVIALALALRTTGRSIPVIQVTQNLPPHAPPPAGWAGPPGPPPRLYPPPLILPHRPEEAARPADPESQG